MTSLSRKEAESQVRSWGFSHVFTWTDGGGARMLSIPYLIPLSHHIPISNYNHIVTLGTDQYSTLKDYQPHKHSNLTTHLILSGSLTIAYPGSEDEKTKTTHGPGERLDVDAGQVHEVWIGPEGCTYVIGE